MKKIAVMLATVVVCGAASLGIAGAATTSTWVKPTQVLYFMPATVQQPTQYVVQCPAGTVVTDGGTTGRASTYVVDSEPSGSTGWLLEVGGNSTSVSLAVWAICIGA